MKDMFAEVSLISAYKAYKASGSHQNAFCGYFVSSSFIILYDLLKK